MSNNSNFNASQSGAGFNIGGAKKTVTMKDLAGIGEGGIEFSRIGAADNSKAWADQFAACVKANDAPYTIIHLDRAQHALPMSAILVTVNMADEDQAFVGCYSIVFENPERLGERNVPAQEQGSLMVPVKPVTSDLYDREWVALCEQTVTRVFQEENKGKKTTFVNAGFSYMTVNTAAIQEVEARVQKSGLFLYYATNALRQALSEEGVSFGAPQITLQDLDSNVALKASYFGAPTRAVDVNNIPYRSDAHIIVRASEKNQQSNSMMKGVPDQDLVRADFYIGIQYLPGIDQFATQNNGFGINNQPVTKLFQAVVNVTNIEALTPRGNTLEYFLLSLTSLGMLHNNLGWATPLYLRGQSTMAGEVNLRDIGALGYVANPAMTGGAPERFEGTNSPSFPESDFKALIGKLFHTYPAYAIDVTRGGEISWMTNVLSGAASNDANIRQKCEAQIRAAANALFGGVFDSVFKQGEKMVISTNNLEPVGYYTANEERPLADFDYLARLNLWGKTDPEAVDEYCRSWVDPNLRAEGRLYARLKGPASKSNVVIKDYAEKLVINPALIAALAACCDKIGLNLNAANSELLNYTGANLLVNPVWNSFGQTGALQTSAFSQSFGGAGRNGMLFNGGFTRFNL